MYATLPRRLRTAIAPRGAWMFASAVALSACCEDGGDGGGIFGGIFGGGRKEEVDLEDEMNYALTTEIAAAETITLSGADTMIDWSRLTVDLLGQDIPAGGITEIRIINFASLTKDEVIDGINADTLSQSDLDQAFIFDAAAGVTSAWVSEFDVFGTLLVPATDFTTARGTFLVSAVTTAPNVADRYRMFEFVTLAPDVPVQTVFLESDSASLSLTVQIDAGTGLPLDPDAKSHTVSWNGLTTDGQGRPIELEDVDTVFLGRFEESLDEMEADFLNLQSLAEEFYSLDVAGYGEVELESLEDASGAKFDGFDGEGTWILGLLCSSCINPSPPFLTPIILTEG